MPTSCDALYTCAAGLLTLSHLSSSALCGISQSQPGDGFAGLMRFNPTEKAKGLLRDWHQICQDEESNAQPAWNKVRHIPEQWMHGATPKLVQTPPPPPAFSIQSCITLIHPPVDPSWDQTDIHSI